VLILLYLAFMCVQYVFPGFLCAQFILFMIFVCSINFSQDLCVRSLLDQSLCVLSLFARDFCVLILFYSGFLCVHFILLRIFVCSVYFALELSVLF